MSTYEKVIWLYFRMRFSLVEIASVMEFELMKYEVKLKSPLKVATWIVANEITQIEKLEGGIIDRDGKRNQTRRKTIHT